MRNFNLEKLTVFNNKLFSQASIDEYALPIKGIVERNKLPLAFVKNNPDNASMLRIDLQAKNYDVVLEKHLNSFESLKNHFPKSYTKINDGKLSVFIPKKENDRAILPLKQLLESNDYHMFLKEDRELPFVVGENVENKVVVDDLARLPHLLIAGLTGGGKSVFLNSVIASLLYHLDPSELQFAMFDMKMVELAFYDKIPHLAYPICTDPAEATKVLEHLVKEMNSRLLTLMKARAVNISRYNKTTKNKLPYLVVIFDEFADLIASNKDTEKLIVSLAQKGRACGIHLILATQRPDRDVITGQIKANIPAKVALTVSDRVNSQIILDENGAEDLNLKGDMLYKNSDGTQRLQGAYITENDKDMIVNTICEKFGTNKFYEKMLLELNEVEETAEIEPYQMQKIFVDGDIKDGQIVMEDDMYDACLLVISKGKCSRAMIRKETGWGDGRSERAIQTMIEKAVISKYDETAKCNPVVVSLEDFKKRYISQGEANV